MNHVVGKTLDALGLDQHLFERWKGQYPERRKGALLGGGEEEEV